jgi:hypothetical protein
MAPTAIEPRPPTKVIQRMRCSSRLSTQTDLSSSVGLSSCAIESNSLAKALLSRGLGYVGELGIGLTGFLLALYRNNSRAVQHYLDRAHGPTADSCHIGPALLTTHEPQQAEQPGEQYEQHRRDNRDGPYDYGPRAGRHQQAQQQRGGCPPGVALADANAKALLI